MLEPEYFSDKADRMIEIYQELENFIFKDIAGRLLESQSVSGTADRLIWKLEQMGESRAEIMKKLSQLTRLSRRELQTILQDAVMTSWKDDLDTFNVLGKNITNPLDNAVVRAVMDAEYRKSQGELHNLTRTTMDKANQDLIRMLDEVDFRVASGVQSYSAAVCDILDNYASKGFEIEYPSGTKRTLEAAVRMCVVTSMNQTSAQITNQYIVEGGIEYVLVSAHVGARPQQMGQPYLAGHENWQGKVYRIRGSEPDFPNLAEMTGYDIDAQGNGKVVDPRGLHGYNCRHSHKPWDKRLRNPYVDENGNPKIDTAENRKLYEEQQKQRAMERAVRKTKRELLMKQEEINRVAETDVKEMLQPEYDRLAHKLHQQNEAYNKFCEEKRLQRQSDRLKIVGFKRKQAAQARGRARAYEHWKTNGMKEKIPMEKAKDIGYTRRTKEEFEQTAQQIREEITQYSDRPSKWSGEINVNNSLLDAGILGTKEWSCDISLVENADDGVIWHEMLHSCSASYYNSDAYSAYEFIEETTVEFLKQQICKEKGIESVLGYVDKVPVLQNINQAFKYGTNLEFAKEIFNVPLPERYQWLENRVDNSLREANASFEDYNEVMKFIEVLKGGENE